MKKWILALMMVLLIMVGGCSQNTGESDKMGQNSLPDKTQDKIEDNIQDETEDETQDETSQAMGAGDPSNPQEQANDDSDYTEDGDKADVSEPAEEASGSEVDNQSTENQSENNEEQAGQAKAELPPSLLTLVPQGYTALMVKLENGPSLNENALAFGDLNQDGLEDVAMVVEANEAGEFGKSRKVIVAYGNSEGGYDEQISSDTAVMSSESGGVWGDPFDSILIDSEKGSIQINHYGGSNWRWYYQADYQENNEVWQLVYFIRGNYFSGSQTMENADESVYDYFNGTISHTSYDEAGNLVESHESMQADTVILLDGEMPW